VLDPAFNIGTGFGQDVERVIALPSGKVLVAGAFITYQGAAHPGLVRLNANGTVDPTFISDPINAPVYDIEIQSDGKIIVAGQFTSSGSAPRAKVLRLEANGALDSTFNNVGSGLNGIVNDASIDSLGRIVVGGYFTSYNSVARAGIARLTATGALDTSFVVGAGVAGSGQIVETVMAHPTTGDVWFGGQFLTYGGTTRNGFARTNSVGTLQATPSLPDPKYIYTINSDPTGRVMYSANAGVLARRLANGDPDPSFAISPGDIPTYTFDMAFQPDGKIIAVGLHYGTTTGGIVTRFTANGAIDSTFSNGQRSGVKSIIAVSIGVNNSVYLGGRFLEFDGLERKHLVRVFAATPTPIPPPIVRKNPGKVRNIKFAFKKAKAIAKWTKPSNDGGAVVTRYQFRVTKANGKKFGKWITVKKPSATITKRRKGATYRIQIRAKNFVGYGAPVTKKFRQRR